MDNKLKGTLLKVIDGIDSELRNMAQSVLDHFYPQPKGRK